MNLNVKRGVMKNKWQWSLILTAVPMLVSLELCARSPVILQQTPSTQMNSNPSHPGIFAPSEDKFQSKDNLIEKLPSHVPTQETRSRLAIQFSAMEHTIQRVSILEEFSTFEIFLKRIMHTLQPISRKLFL